MNVVLVDPRSGRAPGRYGAQLPAEAKGIHCQQFFQCNVTEGHMCKTSLALLSGSGMPRPVGQPYPIGGADSARARRGDVHHPRPGRMSAG